MASLRQWLTGGVGRAGWYGTACLRGKGYFSILGINNKGMKQNMGINPRTLLSTALLFIIVSISCLPAGGLAAPDKDNATTFGDALKKTAMDRAMVLSKLQDYNPADFIAQGTGEMEIYWRSDALKAAFARHYKEVADIVGQVSIDPRFGTFDTLIAQYKSFLDDTQLNEISDEFVRAALRAIEGKQEAFIEATLAGFAQHLNSVYEATQRKIGKDLDQTVQQQFAYWPALSAKLAPLSVKAGDMEGPKRSGAPVAGGIGVLLLVMQKKITAQLMKVMGGKLLGGVASKAVPVIGVLLLAWDLYDATQAKVQMEDTLRKVFIEEYQASLTPELLWEKSKYDVQAEYRDGIKNWVKNIKHDIEQLVEAAAVTINNPSFEAYAKGMDEKGYPVEQVVKQLQSLNKDFGPLVTELPIEKMFYIQSLVPGQVKNEPGFLPRLIDVFDADFIKHVDQHKGLFFQAAWEMGPENLRTVLGQDWSLAQVYDTYRKLLDRDAAENAKKGFILAWQLGLDPRPGVMNATALAKLYAQQDLAKRLVGDEVPQEKLLGILTNDKVRAIVANVYQKDLILGGAFTRGYEIGEIDNRYDDPRKVTDLVNLYRAQNPDADRATADRLIREIRENGWKTDIFARHGNTGLEIATAHIEDPPSAYQLEMAKKAITLYDEGYSLENVKDRQAVEYAYEWRSLGKEFFDLTYPTRSKLGAMGTLIVAMVFVIFLVWGLVFITRLIWGRGRRAHYNTPQTASESYPVRGVGKNEPRRADSLNPPTTPQPLPPGASAPAVTPPAAVTDAQGASPPAIPPATPPQAGPGAAQ